jgi:hypothetical protein
VIAMFLTSVVLLGAVVWVHYRLAAYSGSSRWLTATILTLIAVAFAYTMTTVYVPLTGAEQWFVFVSAFCMAHVPAAAVLQLKHWRRSQLSDSKEDQHDA